MCACARVWMCRYACTHACLWKFLWLPQYVCLWLCCYFAWWLNSKAVAEHRAVLGCHFSSFAGHWDSWGEASIWAVRRWRETWCWVTDTCIEWLCPVGPLLSSLGGLALKSYEESCIHPIIHTYTAPIHSSTLQHTQRNIAADAEALEYIHIDGFAYMQSLTQPQMYRQRQKWMFSLCNHPHGVTHTPTTEQTHTPTNNHPVVSLLLIFLTAVAFMHLQQSS